MKTQIVNTGISLLLKAGKSTIDEIKQITLPIDPKGRELTMLKDEDLHVTLIGIKDFKKFKGVWDDEKVNNYFKEKKVIKDVGTSMVSHFQRVEKDIIEKGKMGILGEAYLIERGEKISAITTMEYEDMYKEIVDQACECQGLENPNPDRLYHITIANNGGGNPFKSIGDVTRKDTCKKGNLVLIRGVSGSGKTTIANLLQALADSPQGGGNSGYSLDLVCNGALKEKGKYDYHLHNYSKHYKQHCMSFSADRYFVKDKKYEFDATKLKEAHSLCQDKTEKAMKDGILTVIVHNTFTEEWEMLHYFALAEKYNYKAITLIAENRHGSVSTHNVPDEALERQKERFDVKL